MKGLLIFLFLSLISTCSLTKGTNEGRPSYVNVKNISSKLMLDGRVWTTENLNIQISESFCRGDDTLNCREYGRLYTWKAAKNACEQLGDRWRLPTNEEWKNLAKMYGGIYDDSNDNGESAYLNLLQDGKAEFNASLAGNREVNGNYKRFKAHGFYWTATEHDNSQAWFYNFAIGSTLLNRHTGDKKRAFSVRCIKEIQN